MEYLVIVFPGSRFTGAIAPALTDAVAARTVRILDLTFVRRTDDGALEHIELQDLDADELGRLDPVEGRVRALLNEDDIQALGQRVPPGSSAALIVWEDLWAKPLADAVREAGGEVVAHERIPATVAGHAMTAALSH
ncbi:hypothetical protein GUY60_09300 [Streptomyces sp. YC537]|uniref:DUF1269 domain-containing protein n=1 Tax=Streptomyces boluensis TaxID=1775135 RepID=A0A964UM29_9ACTN|nr:hypothetical protein [Streptomyces boluensis]